MDRDKLLKKLLDEIALRAENRRIAKATKDSATRANCKAWARKHARNARSILLQLRGYW